MTLCVLDALRQTSRVEAPIFFDTPGRAQDEDHKKAQLEYFWKLRDHQFIIFPHSGEYRVDETISEFSGQIGGAWELLWPVDYAECPECGSNETEPGNTHEHCSDCGIQRDSLELDPGFALVETPAPVELIGKSLTDLRFRSRYGVTVVCIKPADGAFTYATADTVVGPGDTLLVAGESARAEAFADLP